MKINLLHAIILNADEYDEDITFEDAAFGDYIVHAIYDYEGEACIFHNDNIHDEPNKFLEGVKAGVELTGATVDVDEAVIFLEEGESAYNYIDTCHGIRRWIENNLD